jgi:hypothetical protein
LLVISPSGKYKLRRKAVVKAPSEKSMAVGEGRKVEREIERY